MPAIEAPEAAHAQGRAGADPATPRRVLVVEDNPDALRSLLDALALHGHDARGAADGGVALAGVEGFRPDVALLDIGLPGMDGYGSRARCASGCPASRSPRSPATASPRIASAAARPASTCIW